METLNKSIRLLFLIEYDGTDFSGWQWQARGRTVQRTLEGVMQRVFGQPIRLVAAGRTDAGVHSLGQVAHCNVVDCRVPVERIPQAVNNLLPPDVRILQTSIAPPNFHARFSAVRRTYEYCITKRFHPLTRRRAWTPNFLWDDEIIGREIQLLIGRHSFRSFALFNPKEKDYVCDIFEADWKYDAKGCTFTITADRFLHKMVRGIVHSLIDLGRGYYSLEQFSALLHSSTGNAAVRFAPPQGLTLVRVEYPDCY
ncbi:MAG: tRNA pseudouridine(38-40) synthase TruA [Calditrichaeota bacterium]|nr:tRNA pseudouridine(38-40) synthase TruA [Calditrichota bacterium]